ncbi:interleukin-20 receptor subunit alpha [Anguilla anguilla]|uniref:interleukin-20 receptor subunit alpha n=1 Tax=Anguilla anguilla TaxID=7936 RepID=UPI0015A957E1|nr:interleukin-20 receptor subunit alpha [Anguilla anguilla]
MKEHGNEKYKAHGTSVPKKTLLTVLCLLTLEATVVAHGSRVAAPQAVRFSSYNLRNVLEWSPGDGTGNRTRYTVQYAIYGDGEKNKNRVVWRTKRQCMDTLQTLCDLSNETRDLEEEYYGRVKALSAAGASKWITTSRFIPKRQTTFGPPIVKVTVAERKLIVKLKGPMRWKIGNSTKEQSLAKYYPQMMYNVSIHNNNTKKKMIFLLHNNSLEYGLLNYSTEFCVSAKVLFLSLTFQSQASHDQCVTTAKDPFFDQILLVLLGYILPLALTTFVVMLIGCIVYHYIFGNKQEKPSNLWVRHLPVTDLLLTVNLISISVPKPSPEEEPREPDVLIESPFPPKEPDEGKPLVPGNPAYAAQARVPLLAPRLEPTGDDDDGEADAWRCRSAPWRDQSQSSDYGIVVKASSPEEEEEEKKEEEEEEGEGEPEGRGGADVSSSAVGDGARPSEQLPRDDCARWMAYRRQFQAARTSGHEEEEDQEEAEDADTGGSILVDWDPNTGKLQIPSLSLLQMEPDQVEEERPECDQVQPMDIFSNVYVRQSSEASSESEDALTKIENNWALQINM